jgi:hypothetical protein
MSLLRLVEALYACYLNHFTQPDSIIPDQGNPQSYDRYAYTDNNPVNHTDPSGHEKCASSSANNCYAGSDWVIGNTVTEQLATFGVTTSGTWTNEYKLALYSAVWRVGVSFSSARNKGESAASAFNNVYNGVNFDMGDCTACNGAGGHTLDAHHIEFDKNNPFYVITEQRDASLTFDTNVHEIVHELGHAFASLWIEKHSTAGPYSDAFPNDKYFFGDAGFGTAPQYSDHYWRMHPFDISAQDSTVWHHESVADMFLGWTYGSLGTIRAGYMNPKMTNWLNNLP